MEYIGKVKDGVVVFDGDNRPPEGTPVRVQRVEQPKEMTLGERLNQFAGKAIGLPPDMAENHDHYLHGMPKRSPNGLYEGM